MCQTKKNVDCITEILTIICLLQNNSKKDKKCLDSCDKSYLGSPATCEMFNTRPIVLYTGFGNGVPWSMPIDKEDLSCNDTETSCIFRIEKIDNNCATFRVLIPFDDNSCPEPNTFCATDSIFTIDLSCVCAVRCLNDTFVEL